MSTTKIVHASSDPLFDAIRWNRGRMNDIQQRTIRKRRGKLSSKLRHSKMKDKIKSERENSRGTRDVCGLRTKSLFSRRPFTITHD